VNVAEPERPVPETANDREPLFGATVVTPVTRPLPLTVTLGIAPASPKVPTLLLTVARVVTVLLELISPERFGILVVDVAVPLNEVAVMIPAVTFASVVIPVTFKSANVFGAFVIADSIVEVVVASRDVMFFSCLDALMTSVFPILTDVTVVIPALTIFLPSSMMVLF
jgi:hypothetical protein